MKKGLLIAAAALCGLGIVWFLIAGLLTGFHFSQKGVWKTETRTYELNDNNFTKINLSTGDMNVSFYPSDNGKNYLVCEEMPDCAVEMTVSNGTLTVKKTGNGHWFGIFVGEESATFYLTKTAFEALNLECGSGSVTIGAEFSFEKADITCGSGGILLGAKTKFLTAKNGSGDLQLDSFNGETATLTSKSGQITVKNSVFSGLLTASSESGKTEINHVTAGSIEIKSTSGDILLDHATATGELTAQADSGEISLAGADAAGLTLKSKSGDITGTLQSEKIFITSSKSGRVEVPESLSGGKCKATTDSGNIRLSFET